MLTSTEAVNIENWLSLTICLKSTVGVTRSGMFSTTFLIRSQNQAHSGRVGPWARSFLLETVSCLLRGCFCCLLTKSWLALYSPMDCSTPGSSVHGISQARILEWVAISFSKGSSWPRGRTHTSCIGRGAREPTFSGVHLKKNSICVCLQDLVRLKWKLPKIYLYYLC